MSFRARGPVEAVAVPLHAASIIATSALRGARAKARLAGDLLALATVPALTDRDAAPGA